MSQFSQVPSARPMAVQPGDAMPLRYARPGIPISSQLDISLASALIAVTSGPILRPPLPSARAVSSAGRNGPAQQNARFLCGTGRFVFMEK